MSTAPPLEYADIADEFHRRVERIVWCTVATIDERQRPRTRILHPYWDGATGWIATGRHTLKTGHLADNKHVSLLYWDQVHEIVTVEAEATWADTSAEREWLWERFATTPPPVGFDPIMFWKGGPTDPTFGVLRIEPSRIALNALDGQPPRVWRRP